MDDFTAGQPVSSLFEDPQAAQRALYDTLQSFIPLVGNDAKSFLRFAALTNLLIVYWVDSHAFGASKSEVIDSYCKLLRRSWTLNESGVSFLQ